MPTGAVTRSSFRGQHFLQDISIYLFKARGKHSRCFHTSKMSALSPVQCFITGGFCCNHRLCGTWSDLPRLILDYGLCHVFWYRYKSLCPDTWPSWDGRLIDGVSTLVKHLGYKPEEYKLGRFVTPLMPPFHVVLQVCVQCWLKKTFLNSNFRTKIFIRFPKTLFATEDALEVRKHSLGRNLFIYYTE